MYVLNGSYANLHWPKLTNKQLISEIFINNPLQFALVEFADQVIM